MLGRDKEGEIISFVGRLLSENLESIGTKRHEAFKHSCEQMLDLETLLDFDGDADRVDTRFNQADFLITLADHNRLHQESLVVLEFDLGVNLALDHLRWEVSEVEAGLEMQPDISQVVGHSGSHF